MAAMVGQTINRASSTLSMVRASSAVLSETAIQALARDCRARRSEAVACLRQCSHQPAEGGDAMATRQRAVPARPSVTEVHRWVAPQARTPRYRASAGQRSDRSCAPPGRTSEIEAGSNDQRGQRMSVALLQRKIPRTSAAQILQVLLSLCAQGSATQRRRPRWSWLCTLCRIGFLCLCLRSDSLSGAGNQRAGRSVRDTASSLPRCGSMIASRARS